VRAGDGHTSRGTVNLTNAAPGLFAASASGRGPAAGQALYVTQNGDRTYRGLSRTDERGQLVHVPIARPSAGERAFLVLYATGLRGARSVSVTIGGQTATVAYAGPQGSPGLDQLNVEIPASSFGRGEVEVHVAADGGAANAVTVSFE
jgi:uncharacterized protein (TIGR03437 family)